MEVFFCCFLLNRPCFFPSERHALPWFQPGIKPVAVKGGGVGTTEEGNKASTQIRTNQSDVPQVSHAHFTRVALPTHDFARDNEASDLKRAAVVTTLELMQVPLKNVIFSSSPRKKKIVSKANNVCLEIHQYSRVVSASR